MYSTPLGQNVSSFNMYTPTTVTDKNLKNPISRNKSAPSTHVCKLARPMSSQENYPMLSGLRKTHTKKLMNNVTFIYTFKMVTVVYPNRSSIPCSTRLYCFMSPFNLRQYIHYYIRVLYQNSYKIFKDSL